MHRSILEREDKNKNRQAGQESINSIIYFSFSFHILQKKKKSSFQREKTTRPI
jgi:hypothetical protein